MKKNIFTKNLLYFNPNLIFSLDKNDITDDIVDIIVKKNIDLNNDVNNVLKSNYYYLLKRIEYDSEIYNFFDKKNLDSSEYYSLFSEYFKKWPYKHEILFNYKDVLQNINLGEVFGEDNCREYLYVYFDEYESIPDFIKIDNMNVFNDYFKSSECYKLYNQFTKYIDKKIIDSKFESKFIDNIEEGLNNHIYIKDFIKNNLIKNNSYKNRIYEFILQNCDRINVSEYEYFLDSEFYKEYYELHPEKFDSSKYKLSYDDILKKSNLVEHYLKRDDADIEVLQYFYNYIDDAELRLKVIGKIAELGKQKIEKDNDAKISLLYKDKNNIKEFINFEIFTKRQLIEIATIMVDYEYPNNIDFLWKNEYYVQKLMDNNILDDRINLKYFNSYSSETKIQLFNYFKNMNSDKINILLYENNYDINTYHVINDGPIIFSMWNEKFSKDSIFKILKIMKEKKQENEIEFEIKEPLDFEFLLQCNEILPGQIINLKKDIVLKYNAYSEGDILVLLSKIANSIFDKNVIINVNGVHNDIIPSNILEKINEILPSRVKINNTKTIEQVIEIDRTLNNYLYSIQSYLDKNGNLKSLSPYEKYIAIYTIVTNYSKYIEEPEGKNELSRSIYEIVNSSDQKIVCVGYVTLLNVLLKRAGIECDHNQYDNNHVRSIVRIDDDKYNIHTCFICDPTWDCRYTDVLSKTKGKYNYVHLKNHELTELDHVDYLFPSEMIEKSSSSRTPKLKINSNELEKSITDEKLVVALANIRRFVDKNNTMLPGIEIGRDISIEEYNEVAKANELSIKIPDDEIDKYYSSPIINVLDFDKSEMLNVIVKKMKCCNILNMYGIEFEINQYGKVEFYLKKERIKYSSYFEKLYYYLTVFNFMNELKVDVNKTWQDIEEIMNGYANHVIEGIPKEYCNRYHENGTINIPFGDAELCQKVLKINLFNSGSHKKCSEIKEEMLMFRQIDEQKYYEYLANYLFKFNSNIDFNSFINEISVSYPNWEELTINELKELASNFIKEYDKSHKIL